MSKSRAAVAVIVCLVLLAGIYAFWPSGSDLASSPTPQPSHEEAPRSDISQLERTPSATPKIEPISNGNGVITGEAFALDGSRVTGAEVSVRRMYADVPATPRRVEESAVTTQTDESGHFSATGLAFGTYAVSVRSGDRIGAEAISIDRYRPVGHVIVALREGGLGLAGTVVGTNDAPVAGARVALVTHDGEELRLSMRAYWERKTDSAGAFSFDNLAPGSWQAYVTAEGYAPLLTGPLNAGDTGARIVLTQGGSIGGTAVWAENNAPAAGVTLKAQFKGIERIDPFTATVESGGRFTFERLMPGTHQIVPADAAIATVDGAIRVDVVEGKPIADLVVRLAEGGIVRGRVFDAATQEGLADVLVTANAIDPAAPVRWIHSDPTGESGNYEIIGLSASSYALDIFTSNGYRTRFQDHNALKFESAPGSVVEGKDIPVYRGVSVAGVVTDADSRPVSYTKVTARSPGGGYWTETYTDESGLFEIWDFSAGDAIYLRAEGAGRRSVLKGPLTIPAGGISDLKLTLDEQCDAALAGTVVDASGNPVAALVCCTAVNADLDADDPRRFEKTASDGTFLIAGLSAGDYKLGLGPGHTDFLNEVVSAMTVHLDAGQIRGGLRLVYDDAQIAKISGRVTDSDGNPIAIASLSVIGADGNGLPTMSDTNKDGDYTILNVGKDPVTVIVTHPQYATQSAEGIEPGATNVDFVLASPGRISGQVIDAATGQPIAEYDITERPDAFPRGFRHVRDNEGRFSFTVTYQVHQLLVEARGYVSTKHRIQPAGINPGESLDDVVIELVAGNESPEGPQALPPVPDHQ